MQSDYSHSSKHDRIVLSRIRIEAKQVLMFTVPYWQFMSHVR